MTPVPATFGERLLLRFCRPPDSGDYPTTTSSYTLENALHFAQATIPDFAGLVRGRSVLDYGCGPGWQSVAMRKLGARRVVGVDILESWLKHARALAEREACAGEVTFHRELPAGMAGSFDVVISLSSFEHFGDPARELAAMRDAARPGGLVVVSFAEPWLSAHGAHMVHFTRLPWVNVLFSERTVMRVRTLYRHDGARRYEEIEGGLNRMTVARFERCVRSSGMQVEWMKLHPTKRLPLVHRIPVVREFLTSAAACCLRKPA